MKNEVEVEELLRVLEAIRAEQYPDIPATLIKNIVLTQFGNQDDRIQGRRETKNLIDEFLKDIVVIAE